MIEAIESKLRGLRDQNQSRALALNVICRAAGPEDAATLPERIACLGTRHPARVLMLDTDRHARQPESSASVTTSGCELIRLRAHPAAAASLVAPLLQADLPVLLWWRAGDPAAYPEFAGLAHLANRILLDSQQLHLTPSELQHLQQRLPDNAALSDLAWPRLTPWRQMLIQALEAHPRPTAAASMVDAVEEVRIWIGGAEPGLAPLLFAGWLAGQLHWTPEPCNTAGARTLTMTRPGGKHVQLRFMPSSTASGDQPDLAAVEWFGRGDSAVAIRHHGRELQVRIGTGETAIHGYARAESDHVPSEMQTLNEEMSLSGPDPLFSHSLRAGLRILESWRAVAA